MSRYWFRPKRYGYGATPITWQGWAVSFGFVAWLVGLSFVVLIAPQLAGIPPAFGMVAIWAVLVALSILALLRITRAKTDGEWRWRWGDGG